MSIPNVSNQTIAKALQDIADNGRRDSERIIKQEANYEHLTKAMEDLTISTARSAKETAESMTTLANKTGELTTAIKEIALNTTHLEDKVLREIEELKNSHADCVKDRKAYNIRFETLELHNAKASGAEEVGVKIRTNKSAVMVKVLMGVGLLLTAINVYVTYIR